jgi:methylmalonyl-CoA epimerase
MHRPIKKGEGMTRVSHIGIAVRDVEQAAVLYAALGACVSHIETLSDQSVKVAFICLGETEIELLEPLGEEGAVARFIARRGEGIHHMCIEVPDVMTSMASLKAQGARLTSDTPLPGAAGSLVAFVHPASANGVLLELSQPAENKEV